MSRPATTPIPQVASPYEAPPVEAPRPQAFSPYLNAERPGTPRASYEPPIAEAAEPVASAPVAPESEVAPAPITPEPAHVVQPYEPPLDSSRPSAPYTSPPAARPWEAPAAATLAWEPPVTVAPEPAFPATPPAADHAWGPDRLAGSMFAPPESSAPIATEPLPTDTVNNGMVAEPPSTTEPVAQVRPTTEETQLAASRQPILYAPWTGAIPQVQVQAPPVAPDLYSAPASAPKTDEPFLVGGLIPTPIEADEGEIVAPVLPPSAKEIQPHGADPMRDSSTAGEQDFTSSPPSKPGYLPDAPDPVRQLAASALSNASYEAAGAPTPRGGIPRIGSDGDPIPSFGTEAPFVPRFEPFGGVVPAAVPTVSFTTPKPFTPPVSTAPTSPLSDLVVPESDEPAYTPKQQFVDPEAWFSTDTPADAGTPEPVMPDAAVPPARPWSSVDPAEVEYADGASLAVEAGAFGSVIRDEVAVPESSQIPTDSAAVEYEASSIPSWEGIMGGAAATPYAAGRAPSWDEEVAARENAFSPDTEHPPTDVGAPLVDSGLDQGPASQVPPVTPAASFFAATAARNARRVDDIEAESPFAPSDSPYLMGSVDAGGPVAAEPIATQSLDSELSHSTPSETLRAEPIRTTATAYTPPTGEWATSAFSNSGLPTHGDGHGHVENSGNTTSVGEHSTVGATDIDRAADADTASVKPPDNTTMRKTHRRRRLVLWIVLAALLAGAAGTFVYRMYFLPEPEILAVPTIVAEAPMPTAKPIVVTDSSDFVAAMPGTVGTDVLIAYEVTDTVGDTTLPARAAEKVTLEYGPGPSSKVFTVEAFQHYNEEDAKTAYSSYATGATDVEDVKVDGADVGERAYSAKGSTGTVVWRNGTAVFDVKGPADEVLHFYEHFGI